MTKKEILAVLQKLLYEIDTEDGRAELMKKHGTEDMVGTEMEYPYMLGVCAGTIEMILKDEEIVL